MTAARNLFAVVLQRQIFISATIFVGACTWHSAVARAASGCADGTREALVNETTYPNVAGCDGGWTKPGVRNRVARFCQGAGNDNVDNPDGTDCYASDLCEVGWHICGGAADITVAMAGSSDGGSAACAAASTVSDKFYATQASGSGGYTCNNDPSDTNDLFGCGSIGRTPSSGCGFLTKTLGNNCEDDHTTDAWSCSIAGGLAEQTVATKPVGTVGGGVMCCLGGGSTLVLSGDTTSSCSATPTIAGVVVDSGGDPLPNAVVSIAYPSGATLEINSDDPTGEFLVAWPDEEPDVSDDSPVVVGAFVFDTVTRYNGSAFTLSLNDADDDTLCDSADECYGVNSTGDGDHDGICNDNDECIGEDTTGDSDSDGVCDGSDNCLYISNEDQSDLNRNGVGDACEPTSNNLSSVTPLAEGDENCPYGGASISEGLDDGSGDGSSNNGVLEDDEVTQTQYICNGAAGTGNLVQLTTLEKDDAHCANGGTQIDVGNDDGSGGATADDQILSGDEIHKTGYACNGEPSAKSGCAQMEGSLLLLVGIATLWQLRHRRRELV